MRHEAAGIGDVVSSTIISGAGCPTAACAVGPSRDRRLFSSKGLLSMTRHSLCAALCTVALTLSPALALAQAPKTAPKAAAPKAAAGAAKTFTVTGNDTMKF